MVSIKKAKSLKHNETLYEKDSYGSDGCRIRWRVSGKPKTWKRDPNRIQVPIKHGLYDNDYLTEYNKDQFTMTDRCKPKKKKKGMK